MAKETNAICDLKWKRLGLNRFLPLTFTPVIGKILCTVNIAFYDQIYFSFDCLNFKLYLASLFRL